MENSNHSNSMIHMFTYPVFCVKDGIIIEANRYAQNQLISVGTSVKDLLEDNLVEYEAFLGCCMSLTLHVSGAAFLAVVNRFQDTDVFHLYSENANENLRAMALVAKELSEPLTELLNSEVLNSNLNIKRSYYQLQRIANNISAANAYTHGRPYGMEVCNITAVFQEILTEAEELTKKANRKMVYVCPTAPIYCPVDLEILEKAVYNLISNAIKGSPEKGTIRIKISEIGEKVCFSIQNTDNGLGEGQDLFTRYMRPPQIEDGRHGIGLGIPIAQLAASTHNGTLLMDRPKSKTIRFTLTLSTRTRKGDILHSPMVKIDTSGGLRRSYVDLADVLPTSAFKNI